MYQLSNDIKRMIGDKLNSAHNRNAFRSINKSFKYVVQPSVKVPLTWNYERRYPKGTRQSRNGRWSVPYRPPSGNKVRKVKKDGYIPSSRSRVVTTREPHKRKTGQIEVIMPVNPNLAISFKSRGVAGDPELPKEIQRSLHHMHLHPYGIPYITMNPNGKATLHTLVK